MKAGDVKYDPYKFQFELRLVCVILLLSGAMLAGCSQFRAAGFKISNFQNARDSGGRSCGR